MACAGGGRDLGEQCPETQIERREVVRKRPGHPADLAMAVQTFMPDSGVENTSGTRSVPLPGWPAQRGRCNFHVICRGAPW